MSDQDFVAFTIEEQIGRAGATVFRAAYEALAETDVEDDNFLEADAITGAAAVVRAWPGLLAGPQMIPVTEVTGEDDTPAAEDLGEWEAVRLKDGSKVWMLRVADELHVTWVSDNVFGKNVRSEATMFLPDS